LNSCEGAGLQQGMFLLCCMLGAVVLGMWQITKMSALKWEGGVIDKRTER